MARIRYGLGEYRKALEILEPMEATRRADGNVPAPAQLLVDLAAAHTRLGGFRQAAACLDKAFAIESAQVISGWMVHVLLGYADLHNVLGRFEDSLRSCERVLKMRSEIHDVKLLSRLNTLLIENHLALENREAAARHCDEAVKLTDSRSDVDLLETNLWFLGLLYKSKQRLSRAHHQLDLVGKLRKRRGAGDAHADALREMAAIDLCVDRPRQAVQELRQALGLYEKSENVARAVEVLALLAEGHRLLGEYEDARNCIGECLRRGKALGSRAMSAAGYAVCGKISLERGELENAERYIHEAEKECGAEGVLAGDIVEVRCRLAFQRGEFSNALDTVTRGYEAARKVGNRLRMALFLKEKTTIQLALGNVAEARKLLVALLEAARRVHFKVTEGRAHLLQGMILAREGGWDRAVKSFQRAEDLFKEDGSERDLIQLYLERGWALLKMRDHDHAFFAFDEGLYLSKKLGLLYWKCRLQHAIGVLEASVEKGDLTRAEECLRISERYAKQASFRDVQWQVGLQLGNLLRRTGREAEGAARIDEARKVYEAVIREVPEPLQRSYATAWDAKDLESLQAQMAQQQSLADMKQGVEAVDAAGEPFFGLVGSSDAMRRLTADLAALPRSAAWIWLLGAPGTGKRAVASAIHAQFQSRYGHVWVREGHDLEKEAFGSLISEIDRVREEIHKEMPWWYKAAMEGADPKDGAAAQVSVRFTLIVAGADRLPAASRRALVEKVKAEEKSVAGLKVVATMNTGKEANDAIELALVATGTPVFRVPPLSSRAEDIEALARHFLKEAAGPEGQPRILTGEAVARLKEHDWPGNVAELRGVCERIHESVEPGEEAGPDAVEAALAALSLPA
jgi:tetratricopeptide (TPR) repeat protein